MDGRTDGQEFPHVLQDFIPFGSTAKSVMDRLMDRRTDRPTDQQTDGPTDTVTKSRSFAQNSPKVAQRIEGKVAAFVITEMPPPR